MQNYHENIAKILRKYYETLMELLRKHYKNNEKLRMADKEKKRKKKVVCKTARRARSQKKSYGAHNSRFRRKKNFWKFLRNSSFLAKI